MIKKVPIDFLLDTGVPVTLLRRYTWDRVNNKPQTSVQIGGNNGSPIQVHRQCMINIKLEENDLFLKVIVVRYLTTEAVHGLDFLIKMEAEINVREKQIMFRNGDWRFGLNASSARSSSRSVL